MKRVIFVVLLIGLSFSAFSQGWELISPKPTFMDLMGISFPVQDTGYACDQYYVYRTFNDGLTWQRLNVPEGDYSFIQTVKFISANTGFVINGGTIYKTTDYGETWTGNSLSSKNLYFLDDQQGYAYGGINEGIYLTTDGGLSWNGIHSGGNFDSRVTDLEFFTQDTGFCITNFEDTENYTLKQTTDGGSSWTVVTTPFTPRSISLTGNCEIWAGGTRYAGHFNVPLYLYHSSDKGLTWDSVYVAESNYYPQSINEIRFFNSFEGYACHNSNLYTTINGGNTWTESNISATYPNGMMATSCSWTDPLHGYFAGRAGGLARTADRGLTFTRMSQGLNRSWGDTYFFNMDRGVAVLASPTLWDPEMMYTTDGAITWDSCHFSGESMGNIDDVEFADDNYGYATCEYGLYATADGGINWEPRYFDSTWMIMFNKISTPAINHIYNLSSFSLFHSSDRGYSWTNRSPEQFDNGYAGTAFCFIDSLAGYCALDKSGSDHHQQLLRTTDGGLNWVQAAEFNYTDCISKVDFCDEDNGVICIGTLTMVTHDGGLTYNYYETWPGSNAIMFDPMTILIELDSQIFVSYDGGETYIPVYTGYTPMYGSGLNFPLDPDHGFAMGSNGMIMKYDVDYHVNSPTIQAPVVSPLFYPNPAATNITLKEPCVDCTITIYTIEGRPVLTIPDSSGSEIDISALPPGMYLIALTGKEGRRVGKLIKAKS